MMMMVTDGDGMYSWIIHKLIRIGIKYFITWTAKTWQEEKMGEKKRPYSESNLQLATQTI